MDDLSDDFSHLLVSLTFIFSILPSVVRRMGKSECSTDTVKQCASALVCMCLCTFQCLILGQGRPRAHGGLGSLRPLGFQSRAFLPGCYIAVKTAKQLQQQTLEALGRDS